MEKSHHLSLAGTATVGPKGQVVIPADVREKMNIKPGDKLIALYVDSKKAVGFISEESAQDMIDKMGDRLTEFRGIVSRNGEK